MAKEELAKDEMALQRGRQYVAELITEIWDNLGKNNLWKRILKNVIATTLLVSISLIPGSRNTIGRAAYLGAITTVFGHPGRRFGQMAEALILVISGTLLGVAWSLLGLYLGSLVLKDSPPAAYAIRGIFLALAALFHGYLRSRTPRLFIFVLLMIIVSVILLTSVAKAVTPVAATQILYPILLAAGCIILVNLCIFPEFSSRYLGQMTIDTLSDTAKALEDAGSFFIEAEKARSAADKTSQMSADVPKDKPASGASPGASAEEAASSEKASLYARIKAIVQKLFPTASATIETEGSSADHNISLKALTGSKAQIRKKLSDCKAAQQECNFELAVSVLPPRNLKRISVQAMKSYVASTIAVISACESKFALLGGNEEAGHEEDRKVLVSTSPEGDVADQTGLKVSEEESKLRKLRHVIGHGEAELELIKPKREIEFGDARLLRYLLRRIAKPYKNLHVVKARTVEVVVVCIAYAYDVPTLPSGARAPKGILVEELDLHIKLLQEALLQFDVDAISALEGAATIQEMEGEEPDIMPREEVFLMSSFMLNVRQAASHIEDMLKHSRELVRKRHERNDCRRLYAPRIKWSKWLNTGGEEAEAMPASTRKANQSGNADEPEEDDDDAESLGSKKSLLAIRNKEDLDKNLEMGPEAKKTTTAKLLEPTKKEPPNEEISRVLHLRGQLADVVEWAQHSDDVLYALKLTVALFLVLWPSLVASWNTWYSLHRGLWAALQLVLITEVSIGTSVMVFILRGIGTTIGCIWGWAALEARNENRIVTAIMIMIALFPCAYVQLGTKYPKAGMVCIVSICVVSLSTILETVPGSATENFLKRWIAFMIGGVVALIVEVVLLPVKARTRLVDSIAAALHQISEMEKCIAAGIESGVKIDVYAPENFLRFEHASGKANTALSAAETFLPFCSKEPRLKGSFEGLALIYNEMLFVLHQIVDRMDNMLQLRTAYGSGPLEELNAEIYPYRRNVAGSITLTLFAIHGALTTKLPLPQFLPSARLAHLRMINRVREVVLQKVSQGQDDHELTTKLARQRALRRKYMSWNAASAAQAEIIEFLEELIDLTKLLVGANEFRSGLLTRPTYREYAGKGERIELGNEDEAAAAAEAGDEVREPAGSAGLTRRRRGTGMSRESNELEDLPASLRRIQSRKIEAGIRRTRTGESWGKRSQ